MPGKAMCNTFNRKGFCLVLVNTNVTHASSSHHNVSSSRACRGFPVHLICMPLQHRSHWSKWPNRSSHLKIFIFILSFLMFHNLYLGSWFTILVWKDLLLHVHWLQMSELKVIHRLEHQFLFCPDLERSRTYWVQNTELFQSYQMLLCYCSLQDEHNLDF